MAKGLEKCYVPNSFRQTCTVMAAAATYNPDFNTCGCGGGAAAGLEPCTETEVELLKYDWNDKFKEFVKEQFKEVLLRNMRVMDETGMVYPDSTINSNAACATAARPKGIFCKGNNTIAN